MNHSIHQSTAQEWIFNNQTYLVDIRLYNSSTFVPIPAGSVVSINILESLYSVFPSVVMSIDNTGNVIENTVNDVTTGLRERIFSESFNFDSDSREAFFISIKPVDSNTKGESDDKTAALYELTGLYYIYDEDEAIQGSGSSKLKTYYLRDARDQSLDESNLQWSTVDAIKANSKIKYSVSQLSNNFREIETGKAVKHLLTKALGDKNVRFEDDWDDGHTSLFYSSPAQYTAYDDLQALLDRHIAKDSLDNCILRLERNQKFSLRSIENYFKRGFTENGIGEYIVDIFSGTSGNYNTSQDPDVVSDVLPGHGISRGTMALFDGLENFSLLHVANIDSNSGLISTIVHNYDGQSKQFNIECDKHHITNVSDKMQRLYADNMPGRREFKKASPILPINDRKFDNLIIRHDVGNSGTFAEKAHIGINNTLKKALALAPCINFEVRGSSVRTTGRFILLSLQNADKDAPMTKLLVGEWLTTKIAHAFLFSANNYINNITCVKMHTNEPLTGITINTDNLNDSRATFIPVPQGF